MRMIMTMMLFSETGMNEGTKYRSLNVDLRLKTMMMLTVTMLRIRLVPGH